MAEHALFQIATKALMLKDGKVLVLMTPDGYVDFPGGRVDETERHLAWPEALSREIREELGNHIRYEINRTIFVTKRSYFWEKEHLIAAIYFECHYDGGEIELSGEHTSYDWLTPHDLLATEAKFISEDERTQLQTYFGG